MLGADADDTLSNFVQFVLPINITTVTIRFNVGIATLPDGGSTFNIFKNGVDTGDSFNVVNGATGVHLVVFLISYVAGDRIAVQMQNVGTGALEINGEVYCTP